MVNPWFKFYGGEYLSDPKIGALTPQERSCWITLLCMSNTSSIAGIIEYLTVEVLLEKSGIKFDPYSPKEWESCLSVLQKFENMKMITKNNNGTIEINNWMKRQETNMTDAERAKSYRDRKKERHANVTHNVTNVTQEENRIEENREEKSIDTANKFAKPTLEEIKQYCTERNNEVVAERFLDYYQSNGWKVGRNSMKDWKATVRTWEKNELPKSKVPRTFTAKE